METFLIDRDELVLLGAKVKIQDLRSEIAELEQLLNPKAHLVEEHKGQILQAEVDAVLDSSIKTRKKWTAAQRKATSLRMKKYWAQRRAQKKG